MLVKRGKDTKGTFYRWGDTGKKYYYTASNDESRRRAKLKAGKQGRAIKASGYGGK